MIKRRYDAVTGKLGASYSDNITVPEPFLLLTEAQNDAISTDSDYVYYYKDGTYKKVNKALQEAKDAKSKENDQKARAKVESLKITYKKDGQDLLFEFNLQTQTDLTTAGLQLLAGAIQTKTWTTVNNIVAELNAEDITAIGAQFAALIDPIWSDVWSPYQTQIDEAETVEEVNSIVITY